MCIVLIFIFFKVDLNSLVIPNSFLELISLYKKYRRCIFSGWCNMHYQELKIARLELSEQISQLINSQDEEKYIKACFGIRILGKLHPLNLEELLKQISSLLPCKNELSSNFITYILAKFCRRNYLNDLAFIAFELARCTDWLSNSFNFPEINNSLNLLNWFAQFASSVLLSSSQQFLDALAVGLFHRNLQVRLKSEEIISSFLERSKKKGPKILSVFETALRLLNSDRNEEIHGSLIVLSIYCEKNPELFTEDSDYLMNKSKEFILHEEIYISLSSIRFLVALAPIDPNEFKNNHSDYILSIFWQTLKPSNQLINSLIQLIKNLPEIFENNDHRIFSILRGIISIQTEESSISAILLLEIIYLVMPSVFFTRLVEVSGIICLLPLNEEFFKRICPLLIASDILWNLTFKNLGKKLILCFQDNNFENPLKIVSVCPNFDHQTTEILLNLIAPLLNHINPVIRQYTPAALFSLSKDIFSESYELMLYDILVLAVSETIVEVRLAIIDSIKQPYSPYLVFPKVLNLFSVLVNDDSFRVRRATLIILGELVKTYPSIILPIFRRIILDALFICDSSPLLKLQAQTTRCFPIILNSCKPILPVYVPVFIPIAMDYLRTRLCNSFSSKNDSKQFLQQTFFEQQYSFLIAVNFIDSIALMCQMQTELLTPLFKEIADLLIEILSKNTHKLIAISALNALTYIIDYIGVNSRDQFPSLLHTLFIIGSNFTSWRVHSAIFKVYGRFGAVLPFNHIKSDQIFHEDPSNYEIAFINNQISDQEWAISVSSSALLWILDDDLQRPLHFQALKVLSEAFLDSTFSIHPLFHPFLSKLLQAIRSSPKDEIGEYFYLLSNTIEKHPDWCKPFSNNFCKLIDEFKSTSYLTYILGILPIFSEFLQESFAPYIPQIVTSLLDTLFNNETSQQYLIEKILITLTKLSSFASDFVFIILRQTVEIIFNPTSNNNLLIIALQSLISLLMKYDCSTYFSLLIRSCFYCFQNLNELVRVNAVKLLISLSIKMESSFYSYKERAFIQLKQSGLLTEEISNLFYTYVPLLDSNKFHEKKKYIVENSPDTLYSLDNFHIISATLCESTFTSSQWKDWCRGFSLALISQSPWKIVNCCFSLSQSCFAFSMKLLHAAFLSCWSIISESTRYIICESINHALTNHSIPMSVLTTIVGLAEFMEKTEHHLNISYGDLAKAAYRAEKLPFALFCAQKDLESSHLSIPAIEMLLKTYSQLALEDDVRGLIFSLKSSKNIDITAKFAEQLGDWKTAIYLYEKDLNNNESFCGLLASYSMMSDWNSISLHFGRFDNLPNTVKTIAAHIFAEAFCHIGDWNKFDFVIRYCLPDSIDSIIIQCLANYKRGLPYSSLIQNGFDSLGMKAGPLFPHGFSSLIPFLIQAEQLTELNEKPDKKLWSMRSKALHLSYLQIQPLYLMRIQLLGTEKSESEILNLLKLSRNFGEWDIHDRIFSVYYPDFDPHKSSPAITLEYSISLWKRQEKIKAFNIIDSLSKRINHHNDQSLIERIYFLKARWLVRTDDTENEINLLKKASEYCLKAGDQKKNRLFWAWTQTKLYNNKEGNRTQAAINAIEAFIECSDGISEMMQLCSLAFRAGKFPEVFDTIYQKLSSIRTELWLPMIPQLFAQLHNPYENLCNFAQQTIWKCLFHHHHAVIFSLLFSIGMNDKSSPLSKKMMTEFALNQSATVESAAIMYTGMLSACTTKAEFWLDSLNLAAEYFKQNNYNEMRTILEKLFSNLRIINSDADLYFNKLFCDRIGALQTHFKRFFVSKNRNDLSSIWSEYRSICQSLKTEIEAMTSIPMRFVAPRLSELTNINIAIPGTYQSGIDPILISKFSSSLDVFPSKQRPKRIAIMGSDGSEFWYLLKGREDLRLDQRVVQVFHLINDFLPISLPKIITNFIMPLSPTVGLIQWIPGSDTIFKLIREHRETRNIPIDVENKLLVQLTIPKPDDLLPIQRYEALSQILIETNDSILSDIMWLKAPDAESWVKRVNMFSKTSALMSVVGYILGLGDRHPSNIMIHKFTGSVIHVDFGDCFEITKNRILFPELIPFRLTRFMIRAFGPSGYNGSFKKMCLDTVKLIRRKREGVMSVLEIFAHAPLVKNGISIKPNKFLSGLPISLPNDQNEIENDVIKTINRISDKINGKDFESLSRLTQENQVEQLINAATDLYNLSHLYHGWYPLW